jgi:hypothetical protein
VWSLPREISKLKVKEIANQHSSGVCFMRKFMLTSLILVACCFPSLASADDAFNISGTLVAFGGVVGTFSGTFDVNARGQIDNWDITMPSIAAVGTMPVAGMFTFTPSNSSSAFIGRDFEDADGTLSFKSKSADLFLGIPDPGNFGILGVLLPSGASIDGTGESKYFPGPNLYVVSVGSITPAGTVPNVTPEPSSLLLMGSGLAAMLAYRRKRLKQI